MSSHLQHESIWVLNLQYSQIGVGRFRKRQQKCFMQAALVADLLISMQICESAKRKKTESRKYLTAKLVLWLHQYVACNCNHHLRTASTHWSSSETASQNKWGAECLTQHAIIHLAARTCLGAAVHTYTPIPPPPIEAVHFACREVGRTIDPAEMMVSKREAVSMSVLPSSTVEGPEISPSSAHCTISPWENGIFTGRRAEGKVIQAAKLCSPPRM